MKKRQTSLFSGICREIRTKIHQQCAEKSAKFDEKNEKIRKLIQLFNREKILAIFDEKNEIRERCKGVHCVDLDESFQTHIYLQNLASIQPRTSPLRFAGAR